MRLAKHDERTSSMPKFIQQQKPSHDDVARLAYELWEKNGKPSDRDVEFWLEAEQLLLSGALPPRTNRTALRTGQPHTKASFAKPPGALPVAGSSPPVSKEFTTSVRSQTGA